LKGKAFIVSKHSTVQKISEGKASFHIKVQHRSGHIRVNIERCYHPAIKKMKFAAFIQTTFALLGLTIVCQVQSFQNIRIDDKDNWYLADAKCRTASTRGPHVLREYYPLESEKDARTCPSASSNFLIVRSVPLVLWASPSALCPPWKWFDVSH